MKMAMPTGSSMKRHDKDAFSYRFRKGRILHEAISALPYAKGLDAQRMMDIKEKGCPAVPLSAVVGLIAASWRMGDLVAVLTVPEKVVKAACHKVQDSRYGGGSSGERQICHLCICICT